MMALPPRRVHCNACTAVIAAHWESAVVHTPAGRLAASRETPAEQTRRTQPQVIKGLAPWEIRDSLPQAVLRGVPNANAVPGLTPVHHTALQERIDALSGASTP